MERKALIDGDILLHEIGWSGEFFDKETEKQVLLDYDRVSELLHSKIELIIEESESSDAIVFLSNNPQISKMAKKAGLDAPFTPNFRYDVAVTKPYKGTRKNPKPFHFYNIVADLLFNYDCVISVDGYEADDMMAMYQTENDNTIICSRDKDLRICEGWHYSWECGKQRSVGPHLTDKIGSIELVIKESVNQTTGKVTKYKEVKGYGLKFFFAQMIMGDAADNIPGLPKKGPAVAYDLLKDLEDEESLYTAVRNLYEETVGDKAEELFEEQSKLLWMTLEKGKFYVPNFH